MAVKLTSHFPSVSIPPYQFQLAGIMPIIFDARPDTGYDDLLPKRYHFPNNYRALAAQAVGDWVIFRKPRRGPGESGYFAVAQLAGLEADPRDPSSTYARLEGFLDFNHIVAQNRPGALPYEDILRNAPIKSRGAAIQGRSVRPLSTANFAAIVKAGLSDVFDPNNAVRLELDPGHCDPATRALLDAPEEAQERQIKQILLNRKIRDAAFRSAVCTAYDNTCAVTGLKIVNGGGKTEVQAAHIWPVAAGGPDVVQNGLALSGTVHWLFDRGLIKISDEYQLLVSHNKVPSDLLRLFESQMNRIRLPRLKAQWPNKAYLKQHRELFA